MNIGHTVGRTTIARILKEEGIDPAPKRSMTWSTFLQAHWDVIAAADMLTVEVWVKRALIRYHVLFAIELATRRVGILGIIPEPDGPWMEQTARNVTDGFSGFLRGKKYFIIDQDPRFTKKLIEGVPKPGDTEGEIVCESRLGELLNYYRMAA